ncbi:MAG: aminoacyl-tRNA hydrolase [Planctomycetota bacterium]|nr:aminoacyl-tRNA hydrolase [Planctomycetota bacterium]
MKLIAGLGNPGLQYAKTRHNAGFMVVDRLAAKHAPGAIAKGRANAATLEASIGGERILLLKPTTFMNLSGQPIVDAVRFYKLDASAELLVVVDELYLPTGAVRLKPAGGAGGHNGLSDIQRCLGTDAYPRLRVGVGIQPAGGKPPVMDQADFVLSRFSDEEQSLLDQGLSDAVRAAELFAEKGLAAAMNAVNTKNK